MHPYLGAYTDGSTVYGVFNTKALATQAPITLAGTPSLTARKNATAAPDTSGLTLTVDYNAVTGLHHWACDTSTDAVFYAAPAEIFIFLAAGTVDGVSVVGQCIGQFTLAADGLTAAQETDVATATGTGLTAYSAPTSASLSAATSTNVSAVTLVPSTVMSTAASASGIHANVQQINDVPVIGAGTAGNKWRA